jgi:transcriptional regulator with XRE-family HTH domain
VWWSRKKDATAEFLYRVLVGDAQRGFAKQVAAKMGVPYPTLSKYWLGKRRFPASLVRPLFLAMDSDVRVAEFFVLEGSGYRLVRTSDTDTPVDLEALRRTVQELISQAEALRAALKPPGA